MGLLRASASSPGSLAAATQPSLCSPACASRTRSARRRLDVVDDRAPLAGPERSVVDAVRDLGRGHPDRVASPADDVAGVEPRLAVRGAFAGADTSSRCVRGIIRMLVGHHGLPRRSLTGVLKLFAIPAHVSKASIAVRHPAYGLARLLASALLLALVTWEVPEIVPRIGFDTSWQLALNLAADHGLDYGRDIVFTYGPLGFLSQPLMVSVLTGAAGFAYALVAQTVLAAVVLAASSRVYGWLGGTLLTFLALSLPLLLSDVVAYVAFFAAVWLLEQDDPPGAHWLLPLFGAAAAFELLVKLNGGILCLVLFALVAWRLPPRRARAELVLAASFAGSVFLLWLATGNPPAALPGWLKDSRHIVSGYTDAVASDAPGRRSALVYAVLFLVAVAVLLVPRLRSLPRSRWVPLLLVAVVYAFAYIKAGFVREDLHALNFFGALGVGVLAFAWRGVARWAAVGLVVGAAAATVTTPDVSLRSLYQPVTHLRVAVTEARDAVDDGNRTRDEAAARSLARLQLAVPAGDLRLLRGHTVDVVPYETSTIWAYRLRWRPEPLLQWYTAFDAHLDRMNASALVRHGAERILRQRGPTVDAKVAAFEAPATYLAFVCHYRELAADGSWEVLARTHNRCGRPQVIGTVEGQAGKPVAVPHAPRADEIVYARIRFPGSVVDRLESLLFKPLPLPTIQLGGTFRFVPATAGGPLVLRMPASAGLSPLFGGFSGYDWFQLGHVPSPFTVEFTAQPIHGSTALAAPRTPPAGRLTGSELVVRGRRYRIARGAFQGWVDDAEPAGRVGVLAGWAVDPRVPGPAPLVAAFVGDRLAAVSRPSEARPDVAQGLSVSAFGTAGYSLVFPLPPAGQHVRVFALGSGTASELTYPSGYRWR